MKTRLHLKIIGLFSHLIPRRFRSDWTEEWSAELQHRESRPDRDLIRPSLGAFWDALAMQSRRLEEDFWQDVRYGVRTFASSRGVTAAIVLSLALGIGANAALFSVIDSLVIRKLPVKNPDELLLFDWFTRPNVDSYLVGTLAESRHDDVEVNNHAGGIFSHLAFQRFRKRGEAFAEIFAFSRIAQANVLVDGEAEIATGQWVSGGYFGGLGIDASMGRTIADRDDQRSSAPVAMLSHQYWARRFALDRKVLGKAIKVGGATFTVVGVAPPGFDGTLQVGDSPDIYLPLSFEPVLAGSSDRLNTPDFWWVWIMARPKPGVTPARVRDELEPTFQQAAREAFQTAIAEQRMSRRALEGYREAPRLKVISGSQGLNDKRRAYKSSLLILSSLATLVLLIACVNVANLLLSRAATRQGEIAVRFAMGAGRLRLVRQLLTESLLLGVCGGACGVLAAYLGKTLLLRWGPWNSSASSISAHLDIRVFVFAAGLTVIASILSGVVPAVIATRRGLHATLKERARTSTGTSYVGKVLLAGQAAMSVMLLMGAGLFVVTVHNLRDAVVASDPGHVLQFTVDASLNGYDRDRTVALWDLLLDRIREVPGVQAATVASSFRMSRMQFDHPTPGVRAAAFRMSVGPGFLSTLGIPLIAGRDLTPADGLSTPKVVIVNEAFVREFFPNENPIGKDIGGVIVGVARNADHSQLRKEAEATIYSSYRQRIDGPPVSLMTFQIRTVVDPIKLLPGIRTAVHEANPEIALSDVATLAEGIDSLIATENLFARLSTLFGGVALLLTSIGVFGVLSYSVARRTKEFGVRLSLGARPGYVVGLVMFDGLILVGVGVVIGVLGALLAARYITSLLFGLVANNPFVIAAAVAVVVAVAVIACLAPARRASRVVPIDALRYE